MGFKRRTFIKTLISGLIGSQVPLIGSQVPFNPESFFIPHPLQSQLFNAPIDVPFWLHGIPYHQSNGTTGEWLGIKRA